MEVLKQHALHTLQSETQTSVKLYLSDPESVYKKATDPSTKKE